MRVVAALIADASGRVLLAQRPPGKAHAGEWEFPGGKVEDGEGAFAALRRELREELGIEVDAAARFMRVRRPRVGAEMVLEAWRVFEWRGEAQAHEHSAIAWRRADAIDDLPLCAADVPICRAAALPPQLAITPSFDPDDCAALLARVDAVLASGVRLLQWRASGLDRQRYLEIGRDLRSACRRHEARLICNAEPELARAIGADGFHLNGARLMASREPIDRAGAALVMASCHDAEELARAAERGVDAVLLSPVLATRSHPATAALGWDGFQRLLDASDLPAYALGGLRSGDEATARAHGALGIAGISAYFG
jgi:8-oxo-dGTP diphosphatase